MGGRLKARHGVVCRMPGERFGYFGWPSVTRLEDGRLVVASSGLRTRHVCPFGKTVLNVSADDGRTWSAPEVVQDSPLDDRDAGVLCLGGRSLLVSWFTSDTRAYYNEKLRSSLSPEEAAEWDKAIAGMTEATLTRWLGSWVILSADANTWGRPIRAPVNTPHGPIRLKDGALMYLGKEGFERTPARGDITACRSRDGGRTWEKLGSVAPAPGTAFNNYHEPHVAEMEDGRLLGMIRFQYNGKDDPSCASGNTSFSLFQTESSDGGRTWSVAKPTGVYGSPPHLIRHSSGAVACVYGYRQAPCGQRVMFSRNGGRAWDADWILRDDGPDGDLGYPCSVEMPDGSVFTVYYQKYAAGEKCSLLWSRWKMPA